MAKSKIYRDKDTVVLEYDDPVLELRLVRRFTCAKDGGYVQERVHRKWLQAWYRLYLPEVEGTTPEEKSRLQKDRGSPLKSPSLKDLEDVIRTEYRHKRRENGWTTKRPNRNTTGDVT